MSDKGHRDGDRVSMMFDILTKDRRRIALRALDPGEIVEVDELAQRVVEQGGGDDLSRVRTNLHHVDLPMMDRAGLLSYDPDDNHVRTEAECVQTALDVMAEAESMEPPA